MVLHTIGCPACDVLKKKLEAASIEFETNTDEDVMRSLNIDTLPMLQLDDGTLLDFSQAIDFIGEVENE